MVIGEEFARALAAKDSRRLLELLHPDIDFRAMTPNRIWEASDPAGVIEIAFGNWFEDKDVIEALEEVETDAVVDRERVGYRFAVRNPDGRHLVEQQAYFSASDGRIDWMRIVCSGFRVVPSDDA
jgi:hypothetical protein